MPNLKEIRRLSRPRETLKGYLQALHRVVGEDRDILLYATDFIHPAPGMPPEFLVINNEDTQHFMTAISEMKGGNRAKRNRKLDLILHSPGGSAEAAEQIVNYLRAKYSRIRVIVPQNAMSAATMIACAADEIVMGAHSALGPTDPQIISRGHVIAAQSIINEFDYAQKTEGAALEIMKTRIAVWAPGLIDACRKEIALSETVVSDWLHRHMKLGKDKAKAAANKLADANKNLTHGRPLNIDKLASWGLKVRGLEKSQKLQEAVLSVFHAAIVVFENEGAMKLVVNHSGAGVFQEPVIDGAD